MTLLVVGLGNPGVGYLRTRHNIGFISIDYLAQAYNFSYEHKKKLYSDIASGEFEGNKLLFVKPLTYMNLSGKALQAIITYYKLPLENVFIFHDDVDLGLGRIKLKLGGSSGGHNGLQSIDNTIGSNYYRIRIGIGRHNNKDTAQYVLQAFTKGEFEEIMHSVLVIKDNFHLLLGGKIEKFKEQIAIYNNCNISIRE